MTECNAFPCHGDGRVGGKAKATHTVTIRVVATDQLPEWIKETEYCVHDAMYFAAWLPYAYAGEYELVSITPEFNEWWPKDDK